jgi:hypothetical protein
MWQLSILTAGGGRPRVPPCIISAAYEHQRRATGIPDSWISSSHEKNNNTVPDEIEITAARGKYYFTP